ncbi:uncharacterized protein LOC125579429 [Brassica napus]|uniref:uncharacterized protein LOC125579429 n=1 Tax=Brassica napus TaxID=3708 RepID=UPI002078A7B0|nr:uncharacterized protein LOC125579429 [Brassica napus]
MHCQHWVRAGTAHKLSLQLRNQVDQRLTIVLWGDNAEVVSDVLHYSINYSINRALICVVRFGKISVCQSERSVSNVYNISDIALNPDMDEVEAFLKLDQLSEIVQVQMCIITCTIAAIDTDKRWYYLSCKVCGNEILKVSDDGSAGGADDLNTFHNYYCVKCKTYSPKPDTRYMLNLVVLYNTGVTNFLLLENLAQQLLGQPCIALTGGGNTAVIQGRPLPAVLTKLVGKTYVFKINIDKDNYPYTHEPFKVLKIITSTDMIYELAVNHSHVYTGSTNCRAISSQLYPPEGSTSKLCGSYNHVLADYLTPAKRRGSPFSLDVAESLEMNCVTKGSCSVDECGVKKKSKEMYMKEKSDEMHKKKSDEMHKKKSE